MAGSHFSTLDIPQSPTRGDNPAAANLSAFVYSNLMPETARPTSGPQELPANLQFTNDIYEPASLSPAQSQQQVQQIEQQLTNTDPSKIHFTTPAQDAGSKTQPDYYLNAEGKLIKNPNAKPSKDGSINIEVEGNNSAKKAEQYANQLQKQAVQDLINMWKMAHPGETPPEMWTNFVNSTPDSNFANTGDSQNSSTVQPVEQQAYNNNQPAPAGSENYSGAPSGSGSSSPPEGAAGGFSGGEAPMGSNQGGNVSSGSSDLGASNGASTFHSSVTGTDLPYNSPGNVKYDSTPAANTDQILSNANQDLNHQMWKLTDNGASGGNLGCAASVSAVLNQAGNVGHFDAEHVDVLEQQALNQGWTVSSTPQPGDIWIGRGGVSDGHTGIVGPNGTLYNNNSSDGEWHQDSLSMTKEWNNNVYLQPPKH